MMTLLTSVLASCIRGSKSLSSIVRLEQPAKLLEFYDIEGCLYLEQQYTQLNQFDCTIEKHFI